MNNKLKNLLKLGILIFGISLLITNCQKDDTDSVEQIEVEQSNLSINYVSSEKIPDIINLLGSDNSLSSKSTSSKSSVISAPFGGISIENILAVIDTLGNQNYSFTLIPKTPKPNSIFNLVVSVSSSGKDIAIMEYRMAPSFAEAYYGGSKTLTEFTGSILKFPFNPASNVFAKSSGDTCVQNIDEVINCDEINVNNGVIINTGGGGGGSSTTLGSTNTYTGGDGGDVNHNYGGATTGSSNHGGTLITVTYSCACGGVPEIVVVKLTPLNHTNKSSNTKKGSSGSCCDETNVGGSIGINTNTNKIELVNSIALTLRLLSTSQEAIWLNNIATIEQLTSINDLLVTSDYSLEAKAEAKVYIKGQSELENLYNDNKIKLKSKRGKINDRDDQKYTHFGTDGVYAFYTMEDGSTVLSSPTPLILNSDGNLVSEFTSETSNEHYWYIKPEGSNEWSNYLLKDNYTNLAHELEITAKLTLTATGKAIGTYILPVEDIKILITGTDFDGEQVSRMQTAGFMIVGIIPEGKLLKPLSKGTGKVWKVVVKNGDKVFTRTIRELTEETIQHFDNYAEGAKDLLQEALRKGDILDDEIIIEIGQEIADLSAKKGRKLTWTEVKVLFKRGNDFNKKALDEYGYNSVEIVLADGKRLDTYIHGQKILSRKATDIDNIKESTWRNYCNELVTKYKAGKLTNSRKLNAQVNLSGKYYLEIPASNQNAQKLQRFREIAAEYGKFNQIEGIIITFLTE